ncbi:type II secretion system F family protein [Caniella muris]|uniref:type II secretion system F family protein n=1 Tax=Caniella muris TaxID=2941502 RepID=UPI00203B9D3E|nr:type II secretion system F family protein [Caniella muris]
MGKPAMDDGTISAFCETVALLMAAGIQTDEAVAMVAEDAADGLRPVYRTMYDRLAQGATLAQAMAASKAFPAYVQVMAAQGARMGRLEETLLALARRYGDEARLLDRLRTGLGYPAALLCVMSVVLGFTVMGVLPVFTDVYESLSGSLTEGSFSQVATAMAVGWAALAATVAAAAASLAAVAMTGSPRGRARLTALLERFPPTREAAYGLALSRMVAALATGISAGVNADDAMADAVSGVEHPVLAARARAALDLMVDPRDPEGLIPALVKARVVDPVYARLLGATARTGALDETLDDLSRDLADEATGSLMAAIDGVEPVLSAFLSVAVGATLLAVMLPLVGVMASLA